MTKVLLSQDVLVKRENSKECDTLPAGDTVDLPADVADRLIRIGHAEAAGKS